MSPPVKIKEWEFENGEWKKGSVTISKNGNKASARINGNLFAVIKFETPGEFVKWMDKAEKFAKLIVKEGEKENA